jgi:hypothetical protein
MRPRRSKDTFERCINGPTRHDVPGYDCIALFFAILAAESASLNGVPCSFTAYCYAILTRLCARARSAPPRKS